MCTHPRVRQKREWGRELEKIKDMVERYGTGRNVLARPPYYTLPTVRQISQLVTFNLHSCLYQQVDLYVAFTTINICCSCSVDVCRHAYRPSLDLKVHTEYAHHPNLWWRKLKLCLSLGLLWRTRSCRCIGTVTWYANYSSLTWPSSQLLTLHKVTGWNEISLSRSIVTYTVVWSWSNAGRYRVKTVSKAWRKVQHYSVLLLRNNILPLGELRLW